MAVRIRRVAKGGCTGLAMPANRAAFLDVSKTASRKTGHFWLSRRGELAALHRRCTGSAAATPTAPRLAIAVPEGLESGRAKAWFDSGGFPDGVVAAAPSAWVSRGRLSSTRCDIVASARHDPKSLRTDAEANAPMVERRRLLAEERGGHRGANGVV
jgi:hypothetical protein